MPFIAVELDAMKKVPHAARLAGVAEYQLGWGLTQMWHWCWSEKTDLVTADQLAGFFGADAVRALLAFGFLEATGDLYRVKGAKRYLRLAKSRSESGKAGGLATAASGKSLGNLRSKPEGDGSPAEAPPKQTGSNAEAVTKPLHRTPNTEHRSKEEEALSASPTVAVREVFDFWVATMGKGPKTVLDGKRRRNVEARLKEGATVDHLKAAVLGCSRTPHNMGENDRGERYDDLELICRDASHVDRFAQNAADPPRPASTRGLQKAREKPPCEECGSQDTASWGNGRTLCYQHQPQPEVA